LIANRFLQTSLGSADHALIAVEALEAFENQIKVEETMEQNSSGYMDYQTVLSICQHPSGDKTKVHPALESKYVRKSLLPTKSARMAKSTGSLGKLLTKSHNHVSVKKLLDSAAGKELKNALRRLQVREEDLIKWSLSPAEFFKGLHRFVNILQEADSCEQPLLHSALSHT